MPLTETRSPRVETATRSTGASQHAYYVYRHIVCFQETNLVGNVYFAYHVAWQGRCREMFLSEHAREVVEALRGELRLVTLRCGCEYFAELKAFDTLEIRMRLAAITQNRITLVFEYLVEREGGPLLAARGEQEIGCMVEANGLRPTPIPEALASALELYAVR